MQGWERVEKDRQAHVGEAGEEVRVQLASGLPPWQREKTHVEASEGFFSSGAARQRPTLPGLRARRFQPVHDLFYCAL